MEDAHEKGTRNEEEERDPKFRDRKEKPTISEGGSENFPYLAFYSDTNTNPNPTFSNPRPIYKKNQNKIFSSLNLKNRPTPQAQIHFPNPHNSIINNSPWIFDCGATDTMTFDPQDFTHHKPIHRSHIKTANGECVQVQSAGSVHVSPSMHLKNCLLVPSLSHKLLSVSQLTRELNCTILMTSTGCVVQDAQTGTVIGHGTERGGLYYVDETTQ